MPNNKPTQEQIKKLFWEWCGFTLRCPPEKDAYGRGIWNYPEGTYGDLNLDLNNLFKYAVPKLQDKGQIVTLIALEHKGFDCMITALFADEPYIWVKNQEDPTLALFWAIYEVIKN